MELLPCFFVDLEVKPLLAADLLKLLNLLLMHGEFQICQQPFVLSIIYRLELRPCQCRVGTVLELRSTLVHHCREKLRLRLAEDHGGVLQMLMVWLCQVGPDRRSLPQFICVLRQA